MANNEISYLRANLSEAQQALLKERLRGKAESPSSTQSITRRTQYQDTIVSFAQKRLWFLDQLEPGKAFYNIPAALRIRGSLDVEALEKSLSEVINRHEVLRTTFKVKDGEPVQVIGELQPMKLEIT